MPVREAPDRRGRPLRGRMGLLERESSLQAITDALDSIAAGNGAALLFEGHGGMGKTRLHEAALDEGRRRGMRVLRAAGTELEQNLAFGVAGQLVRALVADLPRAARRAFLDEAPERVRSLAGTGEDLPEPGDTGDLTLSHGLFTVMAGAAETRATLLAIDDLHCCDAASLEFVLYVLHRLDELPAAVIMTRRPDSGGEAAAALDRIGSHPRIRLESLTPLGADAARELARAALGDRADADLAQVSVEVTSGNPFYLHELLAALAEEPGVAGPELTRRARALAPDAVIRSLRVRVGRLGSDAAALARAVAILGPDAPLRRAAALCGVSLEAAGGAADALAGAEVLLARAPLRFVHPLVQHAIEQDIPLFERSTRHLDAARLLYADGVEVERVAAHLLLAHAGGDPWVVEQLRAAAREARAAQPAVRYLARALEEPPASELRPDVLAELGTAEAALGRPEAAEHLAHAAEASSDPRRRAELALQLGRALDAQGLHEQAARAYDSGVAELPDESDDPRGLELRDQLEASFFSAASIVPGLQAQALARSVQVIEHAVKGRRTQGQRLLLAQAALHATTSTGESAHNALELAERAWDGGRILVHADAPSLCLTERGELDQAEAVLAEDGPLDDPQDIEDVLRVYSLAELRLAQARPREALEAALLVGQIGERTVRFLGYCPWRTTAAQAALLLGERDRALELAEEELARAERSDVLHLRIRARRVVGLCEQGTRSIRSLRAAARLGADAPPRLETVRALLDLGAALRRENRRTEARGPLAQAADMANRGGAVALHERARGELAAAGARPRRDVLLSGPESLTPSERRIAELAATGQSNREIAQALFVTPKTVEYHLRNTYRKLDIQTRQELAEALSV